MEELTDIQKESRADTRTHIARVQTLLRRVTADLEKRARDHDASKLLPPEVGCFDKYTHTLKTLAYGSPEYKQALAEMKPALDHHYSHNDHHPEFFGERGIHGMGLIQLMEMLVDWKAAGERHGGCLFRSIEMNSSRFKYGDELKEVLLNTARYMGYEPEPTIPDEVWANGVPVFPYGSITDSKGHPAGAYTLKDNSIRFREDTTDGAACYARGSIIRVVFKPFKIDQTFAPAPGSYSCLPYNHILPKAVQLDYSKDPDDRAASERKCDR